MNLLEIFVINLVFTEISAQIWHYPTDRYYEYYVSSLEHNFSQANTSCAQLNAEMITLQSEEEQKFIEELMLTTYNLTGMYY